MIKRIAVIILSTALALSLIGCSKDTIVNNSNRNVGDNRFVEVGDKYKIKQGNYWVYCDTKTNIVYLIGATASSSSITPIYNESGKPMTLEEYNNSK